MGIIPVNSIAGTCRWQGATYLRAPLVQTGREIGVRRGRKITSKRGECEFSECCNRHEWGLIDGSSGRRAWPGERFYKFSLHAEPAADTGARKLRERKSVEDAQSRLLAHSFTDKLIPA